VLHLLCFLADTVISGEDKDKVYDEISGKIDVQG
jgi:hypothetical protein